jgi:hypothetical protein
MKHSGRIFLGAFALTATFGAAAAVADDDPPCSVVAPNVTCVMKKLDNPRGLAFGRDGALFVAEAGRGGAIKKNCSGAGLTCYGLTGAVSRLWLGEKKQVVTGLPSISVPSGGSARGPHDIAMRSRWAPESSPLGAGGAHVTVGFEADPATRGTSRPDLAKLFHIPDSTLYAPSSALCQHDCSSPVVDIGAYERAANPDGAVFESDPYGLIVDDRRRRGEDDDENENEDHHGGGHGQACHDGDDEHGEDRDNLVVTDASGNSLLRIDAQRQISTVAIFPSRGQGRSTDSVPTSVAIGPDGDYYVGELVGIPFVSLTRPPSNIYRVAAAQPHEVTMFLTGFNAIIDMAFHDGDLYVLQHWTTSPQASPRDGQLIRVHCHGRPLVCDGERATVIGGLDGPTAMAFGPDGALYVSHRGASPAFVAGVYTPIGEVLRVEVGRRDDEDADHDDHGEDEE